MERRKGKSKDRESLKEREKEERVKEEIVSLRDVVPRPGPNRTYSTKRPAPYKEERMKGKSVSTRPRSRSPRESPRESPGDENH